VDITQAVNQGIPDRPAGVDTPYGLLTSTITVGKQFKGKRIRDVNVTVQTTGTSATNDAAADLEARLTAPNGATTELFQGLFPGNAIGPLMLDDKTSRFLSSGVANDPRALYTPWVGTAEPDGKPLAVMDGGRVNGVWTLSVRDLDAGNASTLGQWRLNVVAGKPFLVK
jgi:subtilisin-like proprotein convertase family protein